MNKMSAKLSSKDDIMSFARSLCESVVDKTLNELGLTEKEVQVHQGAQAAGVFDKKPQANPQQSNQSQQQPNPYAAKNHPKENFDAPTIDMVVDKLNVIRSGRSFRDSSVQGAMEQYFGKLSKEEQTALLAFLKGISQIVTGGVSGSVAQDPDDSPGPEIQMTKKSDNGTPKGPTGKQVKNVAVVKAPSKSAAIPAKSREDTSAPTPITPRSK